MGSWRRLITVFTERGLQDFGNWGDRLAWASQAGESVPLRVFISSATGALAAYRSQAAEVCHRLRLMPVHMEEFDPQRPAPEQVCRREVESCDVFVLLLAHRYGARPPGSQLSYTELEYGWAAARPETPLLAFVVDPAFPWPPPDIDHGEDAEALARFAARVKSAHEVKPLADVSAISRSSRNALTSASGFTSCADFTRAANRASASASSP